MHNCVEYYDLNDTEHVIKKKYLNGNEVWNKFFFYHVIAEQNSFAILILLFHIYYKNSGMDT